MQPLFDALGTNALAHGDEIAISDGSGSFTHRQLRDTIATFARELSNAPDVVGILAPNGREWVIAQFAAAIAGKTVVPLPAFFSASQLAHIAMDASVKLVLATDATRQTAQSSGLGVREIRTGTQEIAALDPVPGYAQIIYTSGSTGAPKGVRHCGEQIFSIVRMLASATQAGPQDKYLSVLPLAMLLETVSAVFIPALVGGRVHYDDHLAAAIGSGDASGIANAFALHEPTASVLVPQLLEAWIGQLRSAGMRAPASLRFVAVGGAPVAARTAEMAWELGIPAHEGYGLSECCSVVSLNRPGARRAGTVGRPLEALSVAIDRGEIVVDGPTVMDGYLGRGDAARPWRTGDLGSIDRDGFLSVHGRKDNLIVNAFGRNISPEWVETELRADPRIGIAAVTGHGEPSLSALLVPSRFGQAWFSKASEQDVLDLVAQCCAELPSYAVPQAATVLSPEKAMKAGLITGNGQIARDRLADFMISHPGHPGPAPQRELHPIERT